MGAINFNDVYADAYVRESVEITTDRLIRKIPSLASYRDDIRQELWIYIAQSVDQYDLERGGSPATFFRNVIERRIIDIRRHFFVVNGNEMSHCSLDAEDDLPAYAKNDAQMIELRMDLAVVMERLTPPQRQICQLLMDGLSLRNIAARLGIPFSSFMHRHIRPIRDEFRKENIEKYLDLH